MEKPSTVIKCLKCSYEPVSPSYKCSKCGAPLVKLCGSCKAVNSVAKKCCDSCGEPLVVERKRQTLQNIVPAPALPQDAPPAQPPQEAQKPSEQPAPQQPAAQPQAEPKAQPAAESLPPAAEPSPAAQNAPVDSVPAPAAAGRPGFLYPFVVVVALGGLLATAYFLIAPRLPKYQLMGTAKKYLKAFYGGNYAQAYSMLSTPSRNSCTLEAFVDNAARGVSWPSEFRNPSIFLMDKDAAMIKYELKSGTAPWRSDFVSFVREGNTWARPYLWNLFEQADKAIDQNDWHNALNLAQKMYYIDPLDPRTYGYLCVAQHGMGLYEDAKKSCAKAIENAGIYPVGYSMDALVAFQFQLASSYKNTGNFEKALAEFDKLVSPSLPNVTLCGVHSARAQIYVSLEEYESALQETLSAQNVCEEPDSRRQVELYLKTLTGEAKESAISLAQNHRLSLSGPRMMDIWNDRKAKMLESGDFKKLPRDTWMAVHIAGPLYTVMLRVEGGKSRTGVALPSAYAYRFKVDVWNSLVTLEQK